MDKKPGRGTRSGALLPGFSAGGFAYLELCADKRAALRREYALKQLPKAQKELLCAAWTAAGGPFAAND